MKSTQENLPKQLSFSGVIPFQKLPLLQWRPMDGFFPMPRSSSWCLTGFIEMIVCFVANDWSNTPPPNVPPPIEIEIRVYGSIKAYWNKPMVKKSLIRPYFWRCTLGGLGWLATLVAASDMNTKTMIVIVKPTRGDPKLMLHFHLPAYGDLVKRFNKELKALMKFNIKVDLSRQPTFPPNFSFWSRNCHWKFRTNKGNSLTSWHPWVWRGGYFQLGVHPPGNFFTSHQTGSSENRRLKKVPAENGRTVSWLVVEPTHLKKYSSKWVSSSPRFGVKIKNLWVATTQLIILNQQKSAHYHHHPVSFLECDHPCFTFSLPLFFLHTLARQETFELGATRALVGFQNPRFLRPKKKTTWETKGGSYQEGKKSRASWKSP